MGGVQIEQKNYEMPPRDGFTVTLFITVADIDRSADFYERVFGGRILSRGDRKGASNPPYCCLDALGRRFRGLSRTTSTPAHKRVGISAVSSTPVPATARRRGSLRGLCIAGTRVMTTARFSSTRPAVPDCGLHRQFRHAARRCGSQEITDRRLLRWDS